MIEINKISKRFGEFVCLSDVTLSIPDGSIYGLIGENGAGKSTLLRLLSGVYQADEGEILIDGIPMPSVGAKKKIFFMPQLRKKLTANPL